MSRIFINYRREDSSARASALYIALCDHFGEDQVFMDVDSISPGRPFREAIDRAVQSADLVLVVIGKEWLVDADGRRRLEEPDDYVRVELEAVLKSNVRVIPVILEGALMPRGDELPPALAGLNERQALFLPDAKWRLFMDDLLNRVDRALGRPAGQPDATPNRSRPASRSWLRAVTEKLRPARRP
jgi:TIR domain